MLIYKAENKANGKCYIGQTVNSLNDRKSRHINDALNKRNGMYIGRAIRKYGPDNFEWIVIHDGIDDMDFLNQLEIFYISFYSTFENGYNLNAGGNNSLASEETKKKMSEARKGEKHPMYGKYHSEKSLRKMSKAHKGKHLSEEAKRKLSESQKGRKRSEETRKKMSESRKGRNDSQARPVTIGDKYFDSLREAARFLKLTPMAVRYRILHPTKWLNYRYANEGKITNI